MDSVHSSDDLQLIYRPFDRVPNELLALILVWTSKGFDNNAQRFLFPLLIPQLVSNRWKEVGFATPALWTTLEIDEKLPFEALKNYLKRSGGMTIDLNVVHFEFLPLLEQCAPRWKRVTVWMRSQTELDNLVEKNSSIATSLLHFSAVLPYRLENYDLMNVGLSIPKLESLHLRYIDLDWSQAPSSLKNLSELVLTFRDRSEEEVELHALLDVLTSLPRLKCLKIFTLLINVASWSAINEQSEKILLSELEELVLSDFYIHEFLSLTSLINSPNLHSLGVGLLGDDRMPDEVSYTNLGTLSPEYPNLKRLDLWSLPDVPSLLRLAVQNIRSVDALGVRGDGSSADESRIEYEPYFRELNHLCPMVHTLQTRNLDINSLCGLIKDLFPRIGTVYIHWEDADAILGSYSLGAGGVELERAFPQLPRVVLWGKRDEERGYLEAMDERITLGDRVFGKWT